MMEVLLIIAEITLLNEYAPVFISEVRTTTQITSLETTLYTVKALL